jgi:hypothetical protein
MTPNVVQPANITTLIVANGDAKDMEDTQSLHSIFVMPLKK